MSDLDRLDPHAVPPLTRREEVLGASGLNLLVGAWLAASPFVLPYDEGDPVGYPLVAGGLVAVVALARLTVAAACAALGWAGATLGLAIAVGTVWRDVSTTAIANEVASGTAVMVLAGASAAATAAARRGRGR